jgi:hypothetical protein
VATAVVQLTGSAPMTACAAATRETPRSATEFSAHTALHEDWYELADGRIPEGREVTTNSCTHGVERDRTAQAIGHAVGHVFDIVGLIECDRHDGLQASGGVEPERATTLRSSSPNQASLKYAGIQEIPTPNLTARTLYSRLTTNGSLNVHQGSSNAMHPPAKSSVRLGEICPNSSRRESAIQ